MASKRSHVIAVDIGGTKFIAAVVEDGGRILSRVYCPTLAHEGPRKVIDRLILSIRSAAHKSGIDIGDMQGIGVAAAGIIDLNKGLIIESPNLPHWRNIKLIDILYKKFGGPIYLVNDASAAALGEFHLGAGHGVSNMVYLTVSTGIGGGIIINGDLYEGSDGCAGEFGHMIVDTDGPECKCGSRGCLEALASGTAIARMARGRLENTDGSLLSEMNQGSADNITSVMVASAARRGDLLSNEVVKLAGRYLGIGLANIVNIFNPDMIVIGGGVSKMGELILKPARKTMKEHAFKLPARRVSVVKSRLGENAGVIGASIYVTKRVGC